MIEENQTGIKLSKTEEADEYGSNPNQEKDQHSISQYQFT